MADTVNKIKCIVVDDAALMRAMIKQLLASDPQIEVIDTAGSAPVALKKIREQCPDVVTMDIEMPGMDGIALLREVMSDCPVPVVMVSSHTQAGAQKTLEAMEAGAVDYVSKPTGGKGANLHEIAAVLIAKVKQAADTNMAALWRVAASTDESSGLPKRRVSTGEFLFDPQHVIAIGISCGGPASLADIFPDLPEHMPAVLITQHMPAGFTKSFAERLNRMTDLNVKEAERGDEVRPDQVFIAPGDWHMTVRRRARKLVVDLDQGPTVRGHRPSVDRLFRSVAEVCGSNCTGIIMTGMGNDGAEAIGEIQRAGGSAIAQDADSSIVYGMPKAAVKLGNVDRSVALQDIFPKVVQALHASRHGAAQLTGS